MTEPLSLNGLDGANPLGFLAALGTLAICKRISIRSTIHWRPFANSYRPVLKCDSKDIIADLLGALKQEVSDDGKESLPWIQGKVIKRPATEYRSLLRQAVSNSTLTHDRAVNLLAGFATDAITKKSKKDAGLVQESPLSHSNGQGEQHLFKFYRENVEEITYDQLHRSVFGPWQYAEQKWRFRWDPSDGRNFPTGIGSANTDTIGCELGANVLAFNAFEFVTCFPSVSGLLTCGYSRQSTEQGANTTVLTWPIWEDAATFDVVRSLFNLKELTKPHPDHVTCRDQGLLAVYRCQRIVDPNRNLLFSHAYSC